MVRPGRVNINSVFLRDRKEFFPAIQAKRLKPSRLAIKGIEGEKNSHAIDTKRLHATEILSDSRRVEFLPHLGSPTGARPEIVHAERNEDCAIFGDEAPPLRINPNFLE